MIAHDIERKAKELCEGKTIARAVCGSGFTAVELSDGAVGLSFRYPGIEGAKYAGTMAGRPASDLVELVSSLSLQDSSLGIATVNALTAGGRENIPSGSMYDFIDIKPSDTVGIIGNFGKMIDDIKQHSQRVLVFELYPEADMYPIWAEPLLLPECDVVIITGATLINKTTDHIIASSAKAREIVLIGPSVVHMPEVFRPHGVTVLAGAEVTEPEKALHMVSEGAQGNFLIKQVTRPYYARI